MSMITPAFSSDVSQILQAARENFFHRDFTDQQLDLKGLNQLVTETDVNTEKFLVAELTKLLPAASFITEEVTVIRKSNSRFEWIIDPLDGTTNYVHNIPAYSISVGLTENGQAIAGFVYELNRNELFLATEIDEAQCNGKAIHVNVGRSLSDSLVATGFPYFEFDQMEAYIEVLKFSMRNTRGVRRLGSAAVDLAYVACGRFDAFFEYGLNAWDVAAGAYIVQRAGGKVSDFSGGDGHIFGRQILASSLEVYDPYLEALSVLK